MGTTTETTLTYRLLGKEEWPRLAPIFAAYGVSMPSPEISQCAVAEREGEIVGMQMFQILPHMEPIWIHPEESGAVDFRRLVETVEAGLPPGMEYYAFAPNELIAGMAEHVGMERLGWMVLKKAVA